MSYATVTCGGYAGVSPSISYAVPFSMVSYAVAQETMPATRGGLLFDEGTGAYLYDESTGAAITA